MPFLLENSEKANHNINYYHELINHFGSRAKKYDTSSNWVHSKMNLRAIENFITKLINRKVEFTLDLGSGTGAMVYVLDNISSKVIATDICFSMLKEHKIRSGPQEHLPGIDVQEQQRAFIPRPSN